MIAEHQENQAENGEKPFIESRLLPVMREAVATVQLLLFARLKEIYASSTPAWDPAENNKMAGAVVSDLFGTPGAEPETRLYARKNLLHIETELKTLAPRVEDLLGILTDALRMQTICDNQEGNNTLPTLLRARAVGILQEERELPLPSVFMMAVRTMGVQQGVLSRMEVPQEPDACPSCFPE